MLHNQFILHPQIETLVVSFGGVGTTFLARAIHDYQATNCVYDTDGYKHSPLPPLLLQTGRKVRALYVFGDPVEAALSLFRRGYHHHQSKKLQRYLLWRMPIPSSSTVTEFSFGGEDRFAFCKHFDNWFSRFRLYDTLFVRYDAIHESLELIADFLQLPDEFITRFPARRKRHKPVDLDPESLDRLTGIYGDLTARLTALGPASIVPGDDHQRVREIIQHYTTAIGKEYLRQLSHLGRVSRPVKTQLKQPESVVK